MWWSNPPTRSAPKALPSTSAFSRGTRGGPPPSGGGGLIKSVNLEIFWVRFCHTVNTVTPFTWGREELQAWDDVEVEDEEEDEEGVVEDGGKALGDGSLFDDALVHGDMVPHSTLVLDGNTSCGRPVPDSEALNGVLDNFDTQVLGNGAQVHMGGQISVCNANPRVSAQHRRWV